VRRGTKWSVEHGPIPASRFKQLPRRDWTVLVQDPNHFSADAAALLEAFDFIPHARVDDVMVSYAVPGGGVGPHFDSYDVFLVQGFGRRRWRYGAQRDLTLRPGLPVRILRRFTPAHDIVLSPGDMLYLPPRYAHDGVAVDACTTYSIGFRAPAHQELAEAFLDHVRDTLNVPGRYADRGLRASRHPAQLDAATVRRLAAPLARIRWRNADVARFIGRFLSEPKPHVTFEPPARIAPRAFAARARRAGVRLDLRTQLLYDAREVYVNGARVRPGARTRAALQRLADARALEAAALQRAPAELFDVLHDWYAHGYLEFDAS